MNSQDRPRCLEELNSTLVASFWTRLTPVPPSPSQQPSLVLSRKPTSSSAARPRAIGLQRTQCMNVYFTKEVSSGICTRRQTELRSSLVESGTKKPRTTYEFNSKLVGGRSGSAAAKRRLISTRYVPMMIKGRVSAARTEVM